jgi:hypothetical protein
LDEILERTTRAKRTTGLSYTTPTRSAIKWNKTLLDTLLDIEKNPDKYALEVDDETGKVTFTILSALKDEDEYTLRIENEAGVSLCNGFLHVEVSEEESNKNRQKVSLYCLNAYRAVLHDRPQRRVESRLQREKG